MRLHNFPLRQQQFDTAILDEDKGRISSSYQPIHPYAVWPAICRRFVQLILGAHCENPLSFSAAVLSMASQERCLASMGSLNADSSRSLKQ